MNNTAPLLHCYKLNKCYKDGNFRINVLNDINFTLQHSEMIAIVGSSGSGKSTLLHLLGGLDQPTSGDVIFEGQSLNMLSSSSRALLRNRKLGFIYQFHHLLSDFSALENVAMPLLISGAHSKRAKDMAREMLITVGLEKKKNYSPSEMSGGERQRVAIARALINHPSLVLADEPTGNLDQHNADSVLNLLKELNIHYGTAFLVVTHDMRLANRLPYQMEMRDGKLLGIM